MDNFDKVALVTGAGSGVGRATALALHAAGFHVVLAGRKKEALEETANLGAPGAARLLPIATDVTDPAQVARLFAGAQAELGRMDVVFNNAGTFSSGTPFDEVTFDAWQAAVAVNLSGAFLVAQAAFRLMKAQSPRGGRIINNGSVSAHVPRPRSAAYSATKHAITGLTKTIAIEGREWNIACGQIDIGNTATDMTTTMPRGMLQADGRVLPEPTFDVRHVADTVVHMAGLPLEANIPFLTVMATTMPYLGRG